MSGQVLVNSREILNATVTVSGTGAAVSAIDNWEGFQAVLVASSVTGTSPTFDVVLEHSHDGTTWFNLTTFTQVTAATSELKAITGDVMKFIRYDLTAGGTTPSADIEVNFLYNNKRAND